MKAVLWKLAVGMRIWWQPLPRSIFVKNWHPVTLGEKSFMKWVGVWTTDAFEPSVVAIGPPGPVWFPYQVKRRCPNAHCPWTADLSALPAASFSVFSDNAPLHESSWQDLWWVDHVLVSSWKKIRNCVAGCPLCFVSSGWPVTDDQDWGPVTEKVTGITCPLRTEMEEGVGAAANCKREQLLK